MKIILIIFPGKRNHRSRPSPQDPSRCKAQKGPGMGSSPSHLHRQRVHLLRPQNRRHRPIIDRLYRKRLKLPVSLACREGRPEQSRGAQQTRNGQCPAPAQPPQTGRHALGISKGVGVHVRLPNPLSHMYSDIDTETTCPS